MNDAMIEHGEQNAAVLERKQWTTEEGLQLITKMLPIAKKFGFFLALTGGLCYKEGPRKDLDIIIYRQRPVESEMKILDLLMRLQRQFNLTRIDDSDSLRFVWRFDTTEGKRIDLLYPEAPPSHVNDYPQEEE